MRAWRIVALIAGSLGLLLGLGLVVGGTVLLAATGARGDDGWFELDLRPLASDAYAVVADELDLGAEPGPPAWLRRRPDVELRLGVAGAAGQPVFVGLGRRDAVDGWLAGVAVDRVVDVDGRRVVLTRREGDRAPAPPGEQGFWVTSSSGTGAQEITWEPEPGRWAVVVMDAEARPGITADVSVGARAGFLVPLAVTLLVLGLVALALGVLLVWLGARSDDALGGAEHPPPPAAEPGTGREPVALSARLDPGLSRGLWLVKWFLAIPHVLVLIVLWAAFVVLTVVAGVAILFTGRYPRSLFGFNVGVLRWTWRVSAYAFTGGLFTDRYPPFTLGPVPDHPARLDIAYPESLSRGLVLVKWWLLAIPHYLVLAVVLGGGLAATEDNRAGGIGLLGLLVVIAAIGLLFTGRYPGGLFALVVGLNRWVFRVVAYAALMTDRYPPFRLDQGGDEPGREPPPPPAGPADPVQAAVPVGR
jgi:hypothetical protein